MRRFAIGKVTAELAILDDVGTLRGNAFVVVSERTETLSMLQASVSNDVHHVRAVAQLIQLIQRQKTGACKVGFLAEHAIKFNRVTDGLVNLQAELAGTENQGARFLRTLRGRVKRRGLLAHARSVF